MIAVNNVSVYFGAFCLFENISFQINKNDKIGLTGKNGAGKTTLLKLITGLTEVSKGNISKPGDLSIGYLPQHIEYSDTCSVKEETEKAFAEQKNIEKKLHELNNELVDRTDYESESYLELIERVNELNDKLNMFGGAKIDESIEKTLIGLGFKREDFNKPTSQFSGGWRMRIELAKILLQAPDVLLLDEPTNHLDIEAIEWLESFLKNYTGALVLISHDRRFLDTITNRTIELSLGKAYDYNAPYTKYLTLRKERREQQLAAYQNQQKKIEDTEIFIERFRYKSTKAVQVQSRIKQLEKMERIEIDEFDNSGMRLKFPAPPRSGDIVFEMTELSKAYGEKEVIKNIDLIVNRGDKIAFIGRNGEGKTTLSRVLVGDLEYSGNLKLGHNVHIGYFAQNQNQMLDDSLTVFETLDHVAVGEEIRRKIRTILGAFLFSGEDADKKVSVLSGGERARLALAKMLLHPVNLLVLDEPTNHLDMRSKEVLKDALASFEGTLILVSHDRDFLTGLATKIYEFKNKGIKEHLGDINEFLEKRRLLNLSDIEKKKSTNLKETSSTKNSNKEIFEKRKELDREIRKTTKNAERLESFIAECENKIDAINTKLSNPTDNVNIESLYNDSAKLQKEMEKAMRNWEVAVETKEKLEKEREKLV